MGLGEKIKEKEERGKERGKEKREGERKGERKGKREGERDLFRAPKHFIILLKSKIFFEVCANIRNLSNTPVFKPWVRGKNMIQKKGGGAKI